VLWPIFERVREALAARGRSTLSQVYSALADALEAGARPPYDFAVVDEAQDISVAYMHDGRFSPLEEDIGHYSSGVKRNTTLDPNLAKHPEAGLNLSQEDKQALLAFLKTLTDEKYRGTSKRASASTADNARK
jgi:hypothetical protein